MITLDAAHPDHAYAIMNDLHPNDRDWFLGAYAEDSPLEECVRETLEGSEQAFTISNDEGNLLGLWGHGSWDTPTGVGYVWLISTCLLWDEHFGDMARALRHAVLPALDNVYTQYGCTILSKNTRLAKWLELNGFTPEVSSDRTGDAFTLYMRRP